MKSAREAENSFRWEWIEDEESLDVFRPNSPTGNKIPLRGAFDTHQQKETRRRLVTSGTQWTRSQHPVVVVPSNAESDAEGSTSITACRLWVGGNLLETADCNPTTYRDALGVGLVVIDIRWTPEINDVPSGSTFQYRILATAILHDMWDAQLQFMLNPFDNTLALVFCGGGQDFCETHLLQLQIVDVGVLGATSTRRPVEHTQEQLPDITSWLLSCPLVDPSPHAICTGWYFDASSIPGSYFVALFGSMSDNVWMQRIYPIAKHIRTSPTSKRPRLHESGHDRSGDTDCASPVMNFVVETVSEKKKAAVFDAGLELLLGRIAKAGVESVHRDPSIQDCFVASDFLGAENPLKEVQREWGPVRGVVNGTAIQLEVEATIETDERTLELIFLFTLNAIDLTVNDVVVFDLEETVVYDC